ncbi:MAG: hypothetical protein WCK21_02235 [Actinomycetota bacterium]
MAKQQRLNPADVQRDLERFAAAVKETEKAERAAKDKSRKESDERQQRAAAAQAQQRSLADAQRELQKAVADVRQAKQTGRGRAEADAAWKVAKARVIELETGSAPAWAPKPPPVADVDTVAEPPMEEPAVEGV